MTDEEILKRLKQIISENLPELRNREITLDTKITRDLGIDSMSFILLICKVEAAFGVEIPDGEWDHLSGCRDVIAKIRELLPEKASA